MSLGRQKLRITCPGAGITKTLMLTPGVIVLVGNWQRGSCPMGVIVKQGIVAPGVVVLGVVVLEPSSHAQTLQKSFL